MLARCFLILGFGSCAAAFGAAACGAGEDAGPADAGSGAIDAEASDGARIIGEVELGTGATKFEPVLEGQSLDITRGPQGGGALGGYHLFGGARVRGFRPNSLAVEFTMTDPETEEVLGKRSAVITFADRDGEITTSGVAVIFFDCCRAEGEKLVKLRVTVDEAPGAFGSDERIVRTRGICYDPFTFESVCTE